MILKSVLKGVGEFGDIKTELNKLYSKVFRILRFYVNSRNCKKHAVKKHAGFITILEKWFAEKFRK